MKKHTHPKKDIPEADRLAGLKDMTLPQKLEYFWMYDKWILGLILGILILAGIAYNWYQNSKIQTILQITVINSDLIETKDVEHKVEQTLGADGKYETVLLNVGFHADPETGELDSYSQMGFVTQNQARVLDVIILPQKAAQKMDEIGALVPLSEILGDDLTKVSQYVEGNSLNVSSTEVPALYEVEEPVCIGVLLGSKQRENAAAYIRTLFPELES